MDYKAAFAHANRRFIERKQPLPGMDADDAEGRLFVALTCYPVDLVKNLFLKESEYQK